MKRLAVRRATVAAPALVLLLALLPGCVYFNKFYSARKSFNEAQKLYDRPDARATPQQMQLFDKSLRSATKVVVEHPTSSWVDDAVVLMGRTLLGKGDYLKAREKFEELYLNFPQSELMDQALFYHGEAYRRERDWLPALDRYDSLEVRFPKSELMPAARIQRGKIFVAQARFPRAIALLKPEADRGGERELEARLALAEAYFGHQRYDSAAAQYRWVSGKSKSVELIHECILKQGQAQEARGDYTGAIRTYEDWAKQTSNVTYRDQAQTRAGIAMAYAGDPAEGIEKLESVIAARRRTPAAAEALFQIGYIQEVVLDDFESARSTYAKVEEESRNSAFAQQAKQRLENLSRIEALRSSTAPDTSASAGPAAAAFTLAEHYLFEVRNPGRALEEYAKVEREHPDSPFASKAAFARAWILERKLEQPEAADSAWRHVAATYPETQHGRAAQSFLAGDLDSLRATEALQTAFLNHPYTPGATPYVKPSAKLNVQRTGPGQRPGGAAGLADSLARADSLRLAAERMRETEMIPPDTLALGDSLARPDTSAAGDTTRREPPADTSGVAAPDTVQTGLGAALAPGGVPRRSPGTPAGQERALAAERFAWRDSRGRRARV